jgi:hypothetical protein
VFLVFWFLDSNLFVGLVSWGFVPFVLGFFFPLSQLCLCCFGFTIPLLVHWIVS